MLQGEPDPGRPPARDPRLALAAPLAALMSILLLGVYLPQALAAALSVAARKLGG